MGILLGAMSGAAQGWLNDQQSENEQQNKLDLIKAASEAEQSKQIAVQQAQLQAAQDQKEANMQKVNDQAKQNFDAQNSGTAGYDPNNLTPDQQSQFAKMKGDSTFMQKAASDANQPDIATSFAQQGYYNHSAAQPTILPLGSKAISPSGAEIGQNNANAIATARETAANAKGGPGRLTIGQQEEIEKSAMSIAGQRVTSPDPYAPLGATGAQAADQTKANFLKSLVATSAKNQTSAGNMPDIGQLADNITPQVNKFDQFIRGKIDTFVSSAYPNGKISPAAQSALTQTGIPASDFATPKSLSSLLRSSYFTSSNLQASMLHQPMPNDPIEALMKSMQPPAGKPSATPSSNPVSQQTGFLGAIGKAMFPQAGGTSTTAVPEISPYQD